MNTTNIISVLATTLPQAEDDIKSGGTIAGIIIISVILVALWAGSMIAAGYRRVTDRRPPSVRAAAEAAAWQAECEARIRHYDSKG